MARHHARAMHFRTLVSRQGGTHSVVRIGALWRATVLAIVMSSGPLLGSSPTCPGSFPLGANAVNLNAVDWDACRPAPVTAEQKTILMQSLPPAGEVTKLTKSERRKLRDLDAVLRVHGRDGVYDVKVIAAPQAWTGLYGRAVLLISLPALRLLDSGELQALVAHEVGHEYMWQEYEAARARHDTARLRELELACDTVAILTLARIGVNPDRLMKAVEDIFRFNDDRFGRAANDNSYPPLKARRDLAKKISSFIR